MELLVVIFIIAILAGLLMPVLAGARDRARTAKCVSNQKQIGMAMHMYSDDYNGYMTVLNQGKNWDNRIDRTWWTNLLVEGAYLPEPEWANIDMGSASSGTWHCPSVNSNLISWGGGIGILESPHMSDYAVSRKISLFRSPSQRLMLCDSELGDRRTIIALYCSACSPWGASNPARHVAAGRHNGGKDSNITMVDGHVRSMPVSDIIKNPDDIFGHYSH